jgi:hypothetical protein
MDNAREKKNFIHTLQSDNGLAVTQQAKHEVIFNHFIQHIGTYVPRSFRLNLSFLGWQPKSLQHLEEPISQEELQLVIKKPKEKASGPDGFIGRFFSSCWSIVKDLLQAAQHFLSMNQQGLHHLNQAYIVLITKKACPQRIF